VKTVNEMTEAELRDTEVPWPKTPEELQGYISALVDRQHDYGTCVYAMSMAAVAALYYVSYKLGVTGFQASCADLDILARTRKLKRGRIMNYENLLYPQYCDATHFPGLDDLLNDKENIQWLADEARKKLQETKGEAHEDVIRHWNMLAAKAMEL
jgi:hypothetical protein